MPSITVNLIIVESPAKARTIEKFLGKGYKVASSFGHVRDLKKKGMGIDLENGFTPYYEISPQSSKHVGLLKKEVAKSKTIWLATDEDREGEAIAWHLFEVLDLGKYETHRITFNEITKEAVLRAINSPRPINRDLVDAQQARRVIDRIVGFELSPVLWQKIRPGLSAGRVQSVAVRLVIEKESEIKQFESAMHWHLEAGFLLGGVEIKAAYSEDIGTRDEVLALLKRLDDKSWSIVETEKKLLRRSPSPPFTTVSMQQAASSQLGFSVKRTMSCAQKLYEAGHITYMRTDSVNLSEHIRAAIKDWVEQAFGSPFYQSRRFTTKLAHAQEAHEAIRPTDMEYQSTGLRSDERRLYDLIWRRAVESQMADAKINSTRIKIRGGEGIFFLAKVEEIVFPGFMRLKKAGGEDQAAPVFSAHQELGVPTVVARPVFSAPPARYSEASLVKKLEDQGIGRPSTYAPTMEVIQQRGYVVVRDLEAREREIEIIEWRSGDITETKKKERFGAERARMEPSGTAFLVNDFLLQHTASVIDYQFTARLEKNFDRIARGGIAWNDMVGEFYEVFHPRIEAAHQADRPKDTTRRDLGVDPVSGRAVCARVGRYGPFVQIGVKEDAEKPVFASLDKDCDVASLTLEEALRSFRLPRRIGLLPDAISIIGKSGSVFSAEEGEEIIVNKGRYGPYLQYGQKKYISLEKCPVELEKIDMNLAVQLIKEKLSSDAEREILAFGNTRVLRGRYGFYIRSDGRNYRIPKGVEAETLDEKAVTEILSKNARK